MQRQTFKYCILRYKHSQLLGEVVNVGIFFQWSDGDMSFRYPNNFKRVKGLYKEFDEDQLKRNLEALDSKVYGLINKSVNRKNFNISEIIKKDATVLQLSNIKTSLWYADKETVCNDYYELYFSEYKS